MKNLFLFEQHIQNTANSISPSESARSMFETLVRKFDNSYTNFVYSLFSVYCNKYKSFHDKDTELTPAEKSYYIGVFSNCVPQASSYNIYVADTFDLMSEIQISGGIHGLRFNEYMFEDIFSRLEHIYPTCHPSNVIEDMHEIIEGVMNSVELSLLTVIGDEEKTNVIFHLTVMSGGLLFTIY